MEDSEMVNEEDAQADKVLKHPLFNALSLLLELDASYEYDVKPASPMPKVIMHTKLVSHRGQNPSLQPCSNCTTIA